MQGRVFISGVSSEVGRARTEIANDLGARGLLVKVQEEFRQEAGTATTLAKLDAYIRDCVAIIHIAGARSGAFPGAAEAEPFKHLLPQGVTRASYTQWEFHLARHHKRRMSVYIARDYVPDQPAPTSPDEDAASQAAHVALLEALDRGYFGSTDQLCRAVLREDWPTRRTRTPNTLPYGSLGPVFKGREAFLERLRAALGAGGTQAAAVTGQALHGLGGVGKTRLAVEYAWAHAKEHSALLFLSAETPERLASGLAALAGPDILDLPEKDAPQDDVRIPAALGWLEHHPGWLMILDNIDDAVAAKAVGELLPKLRSGQVILTARYSNFPAAIRRFELGMLMPEAASAFLLERTEGLRSPTPDDAALAAKLAGELGNLPLGLEQAAAYIATQRIGFSRYLKLWAEKRQQVLGWLDKDQMSYHHDVGLAATWAASVEKLSPAARRLLERLAFLAPEPVPDFLLDVAVPGEAEDYDAWTARAELFAFSLASKADGAATVGFTVHRLVQDFSKRAMGEARHRAALVEALGWVDAAIVGNPDDVRMWPTAEPLAAHVLWLADAGDVSGIIQPTADLFGKLGLFFAAKSRYTDAEHASRRSLEMSEVIYGSDHPAFAIRVNNLAALLRETNRHEEAEPLIRHALAIAEASHGPRHAKVARPLNSLAALLHDTNRSSDAEPLLRRALAIEEAVHGPNHPNVATPLGNLAEVLRKTNRPLEAEQLCRRALAITETTYGPNHPEVAIWVSNLAGFLAADRRAEAEILCRRALAINEASYGPDHPQVALQLNNLATLLPETTFLAEAEPLLLRALVILESCHGSDHPWTKSARGNLTRLIERLRPN